MASWIIHLRVAQAIWDKKDNLSYHHFIMGNLAPDSGVPTGNGNEFIPSKNISHFAEVDELGKMHIHPQKFAEQYLSVPVRDFDAYSFYLGYYAHLFTDRLWLDEIYPVGIRAFPELHRANKQIFAATIKKDWYDMDYQFLMTHPDFPAWTAYRDAPLFKNKYLPFFSEDAFEERKDFILNFYRRGVMGCTLRNTHLSPDLLQDFILSTAERVSTRFPHTF